MSENEKTTSNLGFEDIVQEFSEMPKVEENQENKFINVDNWTN